MSSLGSSSAASRSPLSVMPPFKRPASDDDIDDTKRARTHACLNCRRLKMKCTLDTQLSETVCIRCLRTDKKCEFEQRGKGKRQTEKVAELEQALVETRKQLSYIMSNLKSPNGNVISSTLTTDSNLGLLANTATSTSPATISYISPPPVSISDQRLGNLNCTSSSHQVFVNSNSSSASLQSITNSRSAFAKALHTSECGYELKQSKVQDVNANKVPSIHPEKKFDINRLMNKPLGWSFGCTQDLITLDYMLGDAQCVQMDMIDKGILNIDAASDAFDFYFTNMYDSSPFVSWSLRDRFNETRTNYSLLFLTIITIGACFTEPLSTYQRLMNELMRAVSDRVVFQGEKTIQNVQALLLLSMHGPANARFENCQNWQISRLAISMAIDIHLNRSFDDDDTNCNSNSGSMNKVQDDIGKYERQRTWLLCFQTDIAISLALRRPQSLRWDGRLNQCLDEIQKTMEHLSLNIRKEIDMILINRIGLYKFLSSVMEILQSCNLFEAKVYEDASLDYLLRGFNKEIDEWWANISKEQKTDSLKIDYFYARAILNEAAMFAMLRVQPCLLDQKFPKRTLLVQSNSYLMYVSIALGSVKEVIEAANRYAKSGELLKANDHVFYQILYAMAVQIKIGSKKWMWEYKKDVNGDKMDSLVSTLCDIVGDDMIIKEVAEKGLEALEIASRPDGAYIANNVYKLCKGFLRLVQRCLDMMLGEMPEENKNIHNRWIFADLLNEQRSEKNNKNTNVSTPSSLTSTIMSPRQSLQVEPSIYGLDPTWMNSNDMAWMIDDSFWKGVFNV